MDSKSESLLNKEQLNKFQDTIAGFRSLMMEYRCAMLEVQTKLEVLNKELSLLHSRNPFESIKSRLKSPESIMEKLDRNGLEYSVENIERNLNDIAGIRVICSF